MENKSTQVEEKKECKYAILQETNGEEYESWYYFIKYEGNQENLEHLNKQLNQVDWRIIDDYSTFDLVLDFLVSETTAKEMTKVDLNHCSFHRKFDGKLEKIDLGFRDSDSNKKKISKSFKILGFGKIENFIDKEDIDPEDLNSQEESSDDSESDESSEEESEETESSEEEKPRNKNKKGKLPESIKNKIQERMKKNKKN